jgi:hypothetical protein
LVLPVLGRLSGREASLLFAFTFLRRWHCGTPTRSLLSSEAAKRRFLTLPASRPPSRKSRRKGNVPLDVDHVVELPADLAGVFDAVRPGHAAVEWEWRISRFYARFGERGVQTVPWSAFVRPVVWAARIRRSTSRLEQPMPNPPAAPARVVTRVGNVGPWMV